MAKPFLSIEIKKPTILKYGFRYLYVFGGLAAFGLVSVSVFENLYESLSYASMIYALLAGALVAGAIIGVGMLIERLWTRILVRNTLLNKPYNYSYVIFSVFRHSSFFAKHPSGRDLNGRLYLRPEKTGWLSSTSTYDVFRESGEPAYAR